MTDPRRVVTSQFPSPQPVQHAGCDSVIPNGHGGTKPLPIMKLPAGFQSAWVFGERAMKALKRSKGVVSLVITSGPTGTPEISIAIPDVTLTNERSN